MKLGALKSITYPEGGVTSLHLEANTIKQVLFDTMVVEPATPIQRAAISCGADNASGDCCPSSVGTVSVNFTQDYIDRGVFKIDLEDVRAENHSNSALCQDDVPNMWDGFIAADYGTLTASNVLTPTGNYSSSYQYDERGNFIQLSREGVYWDGMSWQKQTIDLLSDYVLGSCCFNLKLGSSS